MGGPTLMGTSRVSPSSSIDAGNGDATGTTTQGGGEQAVDVRLIKGEMRASAFRLRAHGSMGWLCIPVAVSAVKEGGAAAASSVTDDDVGRSSPPPRPPSPSN